MTGPGPSSTRFEHARNRICPTVTFRYVELANLRNGHNIAGKGRRQQEVQAGTVKAPLGGWFVASLYLNSAVEGGGREGAEHATWSLEANGDQI